MSVVELAQLFKERDNKTPVGTVVGTVISPPPTIQVSVGDKILLDSSDLIIGALTYKEGINQGDEVILIPSADGQTFFLVEKVVRL